MVNVLSVTICMLLLLRCFSRVRLCVTPQTAAHQAPPSLGFSRQEHWSGCHPSPSLINSETLGNCLMSLSHFPLLYHGDKKSNHFSVSLCGLNKLMHGKGLERCLVQSMYWIYVNHVFIIFLCISQGRKT